MTTLAPGAPRRSPYQGLQPYTEADYAYFFGRDQEITTLAANLGVARLTLFYGPSGVGKSSVLRAGVLHRLQQGAQEAIAAGERPELIPVYFSQWQQEPLTGLRLAIREAVQQFTVNGDQPVFPPAATTDSAGFVHQLQQWTTAHNCELLLILDQFEEYFLYAATPGADDFAQTLIGAVNSPALPVNFLLSLREDALARLDHFKGRIPFLLDNRLSIGHLDRAGGHEAVVKPLYYFNQQQKANYAIEPDLVEAVLDQVGTGKIALSKQGTGGWSEKAFFAVAERIEAPYLQLVLIRLWDQEQANGSIQLRYDTLDELGGATKIVRNYLDSTLSALAPEELALAVRFFDRLVTPSGTKIALTVDELIYYANANQAAIEHVVQQLQDRRLLRGVQAITGTNQYEIFHDVLGGALLEWQARYLADAAEAERIATEQAAHVTSEAQAKTEARRARRNHLTLAALFLLLLSLLCVTNWALQTRQTALNNQRVEIVLRRTLAENLAAQSQLLINHDLGSNDEKLILARDAVLITMLNDDYITANAYMALRNLVETTAFAEQHQDTEYSIIYSVAFSLDGERIVSGSEDKTLHLWDGTTGEHLAQLVGHLSRVRSVTFSPNGQQIASSSEDGTIRLWNAVTGEQIAVLSDIASARSVAFSPDGKRLVSGGSDKIIRLWDVVDLKEVKRLTGHEGRIGAVAVSPDGQYIASGSEDGTIRLWDIAIGKQLAEMTGHTKWVWSVAFSPDGKSIVSGGWDGTVRLWDVNTHKQLKQLIGHKRSVLSVTFSPNGLYIISGGDDHIVYFWNAITGVQIVPLLGHQNRIYAVAFSPDGHRIASGGEGGSLQIWLVPQQLVLRAMSRISRTVPILTEIERAQLGIAPELELLDQHILNPFMIQAEGLELVEQGRILARTGAINEAIDRFEAAMTLDPTLHFEPEPLARRILSNSVQALLFAGRQAAQAGQLDTALSKLAEAVALQPTLNQDALAAEFRQLAASVTPSPTAVAPLSPLATPTPSAALRSPLATPTPTAIATGP